MIQNEKKFYSLCRKENVHPSLLGMEQTLVCTHMNLHVSNRKLQSMTSCMLISLMISFTKKEEKLIT